MIKVGISADLERRINRWDPVTAGDICNELMGLIKMARTKLDSGVPGLSYKRIVEIFREELGSRLVIPDKPAIGWIIRHVNRIKDLGFGEAELRAASKGAARIAKGGSQISIEWLIRDALRFKDLGLEQDSTGSKVRTGRDDDD